MRAIISICLLLLTNACIEESKIRIVDATVPSISSKLDKEMISSFDMMSDKSLIDQNPWLAEDMILVEKTDMTFDVDMMLIIDMKVATLPANTLGISDNGMLICKETFVDADQNHDNGCECNPKNEKCNFIDDDCDGNVDEEKVCADILAKSCEVALGWEHDLNHSRLGIWDDIFWQDGYTETINQKLIRTGGDQKFHPITFSENTRIDSYSIFELDFTCVAEKEENRAVIDWINANCLIALGVNEKTQAENFTINPTDCLLENVLAVVPDLFFVEENDEEPSRRDRCIKTSLANTPSSFSDLQLASELSNESLLAINFVCDDSQIRNRVGYQSYQQNILESMMIVLGFRSVASIERGRLSNNPVDDIGGCARLAQIPERKIVNQNMMPNMENIRCIGTKTNESWNFFKLGIEIVGLGKDQIFMGILGTKMPAMP